MILIYVTYLLLSILMVFLIFYSTLPNFVKASALTVTVLLGLVTQSHYLTQLGKPIEQYPAGEFVYVHHVSIGDDIILWTWDEEQGDRLYVFPYAQESAEKLKEAKKKSEGGETQSGKFTKRGNGEIRPGLEIDRWDGLLAEGSK